MQKRNQHHQNLDIKENMGFISEKKKGRKKRSLVKSWSNDNYITAVFISVDWKYFRSENWPVKGRFWTHWFGSGCRRAR